VKIHLLILLGMMHLTSCSAQKVLPFGSIEVCFPEGRPGYQKVFQNKVRFPDSLRTKENSGIVYFELEIDTSGDISNFQILKGLHEILNEEVRTKVYLTDGMWKPLIVDGHATNYKIRDRFYFELR